MKLSKLFHTLYATVMALPVIIIPIFAININQKSVEPISIEVQEKISVDFNQLVQNNKTYRNIGYTFEIDNGFMTFTGTPERTATSSTKISELYSKANHTYYLRMTDKTGTSPNLLFYSFTNKGNGSIISSFNIINNPQRIFTLSNNDCSFEIGIAATGGVSFNSTCYIDIFDLTQMYGTGNEPTIQQFNSDYPDNHYGFTESQKMLVDKPSPTTYDDTDIGSQFLYSLYKPVQDYFNFGQYFGLSGMYDWFQLNIFNGTAPLSFYIVFNVMIYWLFISLIWLLFDILIYVPMVIHKWLDKAEM